MRVPSPSTNVHVIYIGFPLLACRTHSAPHSLGPLPNQFLSTKTFGTIDDKHGIRDLFCGDLKS